MSLPGTQTGPSGPAADLRLSDTNFAATAEPPATTREHRPFRTDGASRGARLYLRLGRLVDTAAGPILLLAAFMLTNFPASLAGFQELLGLRVTVKNLIYVIGFAIVWRMICSLWGLYDWTKVRQPRQEAWRVVAACTTGSALASIFPAISVTGAFGMETVLVFWLGATATLVAGRHVLRGLVLWPQAAPHDVLIVGTGPRALSTFTRLSNSPEERSRVIGFVDSEVWEPTRLPEGTYLGSLANFEEILMRSAVDEVLIALPIRSRYEDVQETLRICERVGVRAKYLADVFQHNQARARFESGDAVPGIAMLMAPDDHRLLVKRAVDVVGAAVGLVLLSPLLLLVVVAIKLTSPGPVLFIQPRYGLNRRRFNMLKFRTMVDGADQLQAELEHLNEVEGPAFKIRNDPRITRLGHVLRRTSIDELPQLVNVLRGDMSLVGPRPLPERDVHRFAEGKLMRRFSVRPGLTCLWQVSGRSELSFDRWLELDLQYVDEWTLLLDLRILFRTVPAVVRGTGAS